MGLSEKETQKVQQLEKENGPTTIVDSSLVVVDPPTTIESISIASNNDKGSFDVGFADASAGLHVGFENTSGVTYVHIYKQPRNGRKSLTTIQGVPTQFDYKKLLKAFKKIFSCNGTIVEDPELGPVMQVQGDHRHKIAQFLISEHIVEKRDLKVHGE